MAVLLGALSCSCSTNDTYELDLVVRDGRVVPYLCWEGSQCNRGSSDDWWPQPGECHFVSDVVGTSHRPECALQARFLADGDLVPEGGVLPGKTYELIVEGCGYGPSSISLASPMVTLEITDVAQDPNGSVSVDYLAQGANAAVMRAGNWTSKKTCASAITGNFMQDNPYVQEAQLSAYDLSEHETDFGTLRVWMGTEQMLDLGP